MNSKLIAVCEALGLGSDPEKILTPLRKLYDELDRDTHARAKDLELPCRAGCDACCHESVFLSAPEMLAVADHLLATRTKDELDALIAAMKNLAIEFRDELELLETITPGEERDEVAARIKFRCPLLGHDGACTIYPARELNARTFGQSWDPTRNAAYGCTLTHERLRVLPPESGPNMIDAREARRRLRDAVPGTEVVHVYPWWFDRIANVLLP